MNDDGKSVAPTQAAAGSIWGDGFDIRAYGSIASSFGHGRAIGYDYEDHGEDWAEFSIDPKAELVGIASSGTMASGAIISLVDACGSAAVYQQLDGFRPLVTVDLRLDYLAPALGSDRIVARCTATKITRKVAFVQGQARIDGGKTIANAAITYMVTD